jgi:hypothetical protein
MIDMHIRYFSDVSTQVEKLVRILKHKLRPDNAYFKAQGFDAILSAPKEELHQLLIGLYGEHLRYNVWDRECFTHWQPKYHQRLRQKRLSDIHNFEAAFQDYFSRLD